MDIIPSSNMNCQLNPYIYMNGNNLTAVGFQSSCNDLILGRLRFSGIAHYVLVIAGLESDE